MFAFEKVHFLTLRFFVVADKSNFYPIKHILDKTRDFDF